MMVSITVRCFKQHDGLFFQTALSFASLNSMMVLRLKQWNLLIIRVMLKPLIVLMASAASCLMVLFLYRLIPYKLHTLGLVQFSPDNLIGMPHAHLHTKQNELISQLSRLTSVPLLGQFYKKEMISELVELKHWKEALSETNIAVETFVHRHSFPIWFYKALSQCMLELIPDCEKSTRHAEYLLDPQYKKSMAELYKFLQNKMKHQHSPEVEQAKRETARLSIQEL